MYTSIIKTYITKILTLANIFFVFSQLFILKLIELVIIKTFW